MERPQAVTAFGILNIVFATIGILGVLATLFQAKALGSSPAVAAMYSIPEYVTWSQVHSSIGGVLSVVLLVSGIGLLKLKPWARIAAIGYALGIIALSCVSSFAFGRYVLPVMLEKAATLSGPDGLALKIGAYATTSAGFVGLIYPALLLFFMTRRHIKAAFDAPLQPPPLTGR
jgi:hypothetical protein